MVEFSTLAMKEASKADLLSIPGVIGIGAGSGSGDHINIYVKELTSDIIGKLPASLNSVPTRIIEVGDIKAFQGERTERIRPARPGCSIGNVGITAGTFGAIVNSLGRRGILSNAHVLVADPRYTTMPDYAVVQPGIYDGGRAPADRIGQTVRWVPLNPSGTNTVDCALAMPDSDSLISDDIIDIGVPAGVAAAVQDMSVQKSGRSSGLNTGIVLDIHATIKVGYEQGFEATFDDLIITSQMGIPGDSGSLLLDTNKRAVGLLFAGSDSVTCYCKIGNVQSALGVSVAGGGGTVQAGLGLLVIPMILSGLYYLLRGKH